jgi:hypothetical protein
MIDMHLAIPLSDRRPSDNSDIGEFAITDCGVGYGVPI